MALTRTATHLKFLRGTAAKADAYTPQAGEPVFTIDTTTGANPVTTVSLRIGDGSLAGGYEFASKATVESLISTALTSVIANNTTYGTVKLSDATDGTQTAASGGTAATPAAVKAVKDALDTLSNTVDTFLTGSDDSNGTLDRLSELVAQIEANKGSISAILDDKVDKTSISDAVNLDSSTNVASSKAVKTAYDAAVAQATDSVFGQVELSDAVNDSTSDVSAHIAATPKAVATTYAAATRTANGTVAGQVLLSDDPEGTEVAATDGTAATPAAVAAVATFAADMDFGTLA